MLQNKNVFYILHFFKIVTFIFTLVKILENKNELYFLNSKDEKQ